MDALSSAALAGGLAWASGIRLYATLFLAGLLGRLQVVALPEGLQVLSDDWVLIVSGVLMCIEFLADKVPAIDSAWDAVHSFIRIPIGTLLAWGVFSHASAGEQVAAALLGGTLVAGTHLAKAGSRALINTSPEPFSNVAASATEDVSWLGAFWLMWRHPLIMLALLALFVLLLCWWLPKLWRGLRLMRQRWQELRMRLSHSSLPPP